MNTQPIRFKFRCAAFGYAYYDCISLAGTFEIRHGNGQSCGNVEDCPAIEPHYSGTITPEVQAAWQSYCANKRTEYMAWRERNAHLFTQKAQVAQ